MRFQSLHPVAQRQRIVRTQTLDIVNLESRAFHAELDVAYQIQLAIGKHLVVDELRSHGLVPAFLVVPDAMVQKQPSRAQHAAHCRKIAGQSGQAGMLEHADARDLVEGRARRQVTVAEQLDAEIRMRIEFLLVCSLAGCAAIGSSWEQTEATDADSRAGMAMCRTQVSKIPLTPKLSSVPYDPNEVGPHEPAVGLQDMANHRKAVNDCMEAQGWTRR